MLARFVSALALLASGCVFWTPISRSPAPTAKVLTDVPMQKWDIKSCGAGALSTVLQHYGDATSMDQWQAALPKTRGGVMSIDLVLAARERGFDARLVTGDAALVEAELRDGNPVILMLQVIQAPGKGYDFFHYIVIDGYDDFQKLVRVQFGDGRARWTTMQRLNAAWRATKYATILIHRGDPNAPALRAAVQLEEQGKIALAAQAYREILAKDPRSLLAWTNLGNAEMRLSRNAAAEEAFRKALEIDPDAADTLNNLAWLLFEQKRISEAEPLARKAVMTKAPDPWIRLDTLAHILAARGACDEAAMTYRQAIAQVPESRRDDKRALEDAASKIATCSPAAQTGPPSSTN